MKSHNWRLRVNFVTKDCDKDCMKENKVFNGYALNKRFLSVFRTSM